MQIIMLMYGLVRPANSRTIAPSWSRGFSWWSKSGRDHVDCFYVGPDRSRGGRRHGGRPSPLWRRMGSFDSVNGIDRKASTSFDEHIRRYTGQTASLRLDKRLISWDVTDHFQVTATRGREWTWSWSGAAVSLCHVIYNRWSICSLRLHSDLMGGWPSGTYPSALLLTTEPFLHFG